MTCRKDEGHMARMGKERSENQGEESKTRPCDFGARNKCYSIK